MQNHFRKKIIDLFFDKVDSYWINELEIVLSNVSINEFNRKISINILQKKYEISPFEALDYIIDKLEQ